MRGERSAVGRERGEGEMTVEVDTQQVQHNLWIKLAECESLV